MFVSFCVNVCHCVYECVIFVCVRENLVRDIKKYKKINLCHFFDMRVCKVSLVFRKCVYVTGCSIKNRSILRSFIDVLNYFFFLIQI